jgi:hypothetical protein
MQGLVWIAMHRKNPRFTLEQAGRVKFSQLETLTNGNGDGEKAKTASALPSPPDRAAALAEALLAGINLWEIAGVRPWECDRLTPQDLHAIQAYHRMKGVADG